MNKNRLAALGLTAGLLTGGAAALTFVPGIAGAQTAETPVTTESPSSTPAPARGQWMKDALAGLVSDGTLTQAQADAVSTALQAARPEGGHGGGHGGGHRGGGHRGAHLSVAATALGMTVDELRVALDSGQTIAAVATGKGIDPETVVSALVAEAKSRVDAKVAAGGLTQAEGDAKLAGAEERARASVNNVRPAKPAQPAS